MPSRKLRRRQRARPLQHAPRNGVLLLEHDVVDAERSEMIQASRDVFAGHCVLPTRPPLFGKRLEIIELPAFFPVDVHGADRRRAEDPRVKSLSGVREQEDGVFWCIGASKISERVQLFCFQRGIVPDASRDIE